jgi:ammonium transporter, Amt family
MNTHLAAAAAMCGWLLVERLRGGHATTLGAASGAVAGLVAITPCAGFVGGMSPVFIGLVAGMVCYLAIWIKKALRLDDALDVIAVHLVGGLLGSLLLGLFADPAINPIVSNPGLFISDGGLALLGDQLIASLATLAYSFTMSVIIAKVIQATIGLRVTPEEELEGLDRSQHAETAYILSDLGSSLGLSDERAYESRSLQGSTHGGA